MARQVKGLASSLLWLRSLLWRRFDPCPVSVHVLRAWLKKKSWVQPRAQNRQAALLWGVNAAGASPALLVPLLASVTRAFFGESWV